MTRLRTIANCHAAPERDVRESIWKPHDPWSPDCPDPLAGTVDPKAAGYRNDPGQWRLHYRVPMPAMDLAESACRAANKHLASMTPERRAELEREWK